MSDQYVDFNDTKNIEPKVSRDKYEVKGTKYGFDSRWDSELIIEENTIYEIDTECIECRKKRKVHYTEPQ